MTYKLSRESWSADVAEAQAIFFAMQTAKDMGITNAIFESDSLHVISILNNDDQCLSEIAARGRSSIVKGTTWLIYWQKACILDSSGSA
ncbi:conserved hypothetical protein [Ricinus communis]|uniref:RNase H type-1 domain-containing protein n=1 Tax=Ricinus communis TaxID=3988 RepID=B9RCB3_RICCO|nr:conserved hypothetical protein [Ricinus communis]